MISSETGSRGKSTLPVPVFQNKKKKNCMIVTEIFHISLHTYTIYGLNE